MDTATEGARAAPFESASELREAHAHLLDLLDARLGQDASAQGEAAALAQLEPEVHQFVQRAAATGAYIEEITERTACQTLLDYWASTLSRAGMPMGGMRLARFDREMLPDLKDKPCPYVGLEAFRDPTFFFGREADIKALIAQLRKAPLVIVTGASGSGKSSLVIGGVLPALAVAAAQDGPKGRRIIATFVPGTAVLEHLAEAVLQGRAEDAADVSVEAAALRRDSGHLHAMIGGAGARPVVITIDQFEEVFTLSDPAERHALVENLARLLVAPERHRVILTVREEFKNRITELMLLAPFFDGAWYSMRPMGYDALRAAVEKPADRQNLQFQSGIVDDLVKKVLGQPAALPLLQFALRSLWNARDRNRITSEVYGKVGDPLNALQNSAKRFYDSLAPQTQEEVKRILLELVRVDELLEAYRQPVAKGRLLQAGKANTEEVLGLLADHDYVRITPGRGGADALVEVKHEALVRNWPLLVGWIDDKRNQMRQRFALTQAALRWAEKGRPAEGLLTGWQLQLLTGWQLQATETQADLSDLEQEFVAASAAAIDCAEQRALRRRMHAMAGAVTAAVVALVVAMIWLLAITKRDAEIQDQNAKMDQQNREIKKQYTTIISQNVELKEQAKEIQQQADEKERLYNQLNRALRLQPQNYVNDQRDLALLLSIEAIRRAPRDPEPVRSLLSILTTNIELKSIFPGHVGEVWNVKVSPDKKMIASASYDEVGREGTIAVRDPDQGHMRYAPLKGHSEQITGLAFSPDGKILASASFDKTVMLWDLATGKVHTLFDDDAIIGVAINKDGTVLAAAPADGVVTLWNLKTRDKRHTTYLPRGSASSALAFSPKDVALLACATGGGRDARIVLWDTRTRTKVLKPIEVGTPVFTMAFSHDGKTIASGNRDGSVKAWDVTTRAPLPPGKYLNRPGTSNLYPRGVYGIAFSPDDRRLASVSLDRTVYVHYLDQRDREPRRLNGYTKPFRNVDFIGNDTLATGTDNGIVVIWDLSNSYPFESPLSPENTKATSAEFADDGRTLISHWDNQLQFWPINRWSSTPQSVTARDQPAIRLNLRAPNGERLVTIGTDNSIALWDVAKRSQISMLVPRRGGYILAAAFSADSRTLAVSLRKNEDGEKGEIWLVDLYCGTHEVMATGSDHPVFAVAFSPTANLLAASEEGSASIWNLDTPKPQPRPFGRLVAGETFLSLTFSPDGKLLAAGGTDGAIQLWDFGGNTGTSLDAHRGPVSALAFSPDGKQLASGGWDKSIFLWDVNTHQVLMTRPIVRHDDPISRIAFAPDGHLMASSADDGEVFLWELNMSRLLFLACEVAGRNLAQVEWSHSFGEEDFRVTCPAAKAAEADALVLAGDRVRAEQLYRAALQAAIEAKEARSANSVCWLGSIDGFAALVKPACEQAVQLASEVERDRIRDSRGVARALTGDVAGAAEDFGGLVEFLKQLPDLTVDFQAILRRREDWIAALKAGHNPFDEQSLKALRSE